MDNLKFSIIVPVYKVEKYLSRCVESLLSQTFKSFEVILIDDGSPDNCPQLCDEYSKKDSRVRVIHQENAGVSVARNSGIDASIGEYIGFVDSDDWVDSDWLQTVNEYIKNSEYDVVNWGFCNDNENGTKSCGNWPEKWNLYKLEKVNPTLWHSPWTKVIKKEILQKNKISFPLNICCCEDMYLSFCVYYYAKKVCNITNFCPYHYFNNSQSATKKKNEKFYTDVVKVVTLLDNFINEKEDRKKFKKLIYNKKIIAKSYLLTTYQEPKICEWRKLFPEVNLYASFCSKRFYIYLFVFFKMDKIAKKVIFAFKKIKRM